MQVWKKGLAALLLLSLLPAMALAGNRYGLPATADDATCEALAVQWYETVHRPSLPAPAAGASYDDWGREVGGPGRIVATGGIDGFDNTGHWWLSQGALDWVRARLEAEAAARAASAAAELSSKGPSSDTTDKTDPDGSPSEGASERTKPEGTTSDDGSDGTTADGTTADGATADETASEGSTDGTRGSNGEPGPAGAPSPIENDAFAGLGADGSEDVPDLGADSKAEKALAIALQQVGKPYVWGNEGPDSFDCSGLMYYSYGKVGIRLPRVAKDQAKKYPKVSMDRLRPGDLIFFYDYGHVGMYVGDGKYVHAPGRGKTVRVESLAGKDCDSAHRVI